jgi:hypothetical protein
MSIVYGEDKGCVIPCFKDVCYEPIDSLRDFLKESALNAFFGLIKRRIFSQNVIIIADDMK